MQQIPGGTVLPATYGMYVGRCGCVCAWVGVWVGMNATGMKYEECAYEDCVYGGVRMCV